MTSAHHHDHDGHHHHAHGAAAPRGRVAQAPAASLLRTSAAQRLVGVSVALAAVWTAVIWALA